MCTYFDISINRDQADLIYCGYIGVSSVMEFCLLYGKHTPTLRFTFYVLALISGGSYCSFSLLHYSSYYTYCSKKARPVTVLVLIQGRHQDFNPTKAKIQNFKKKAPWKNVFGRQKVSKKYTNRGLLWRAYGTYKRKNKIVFKINSKIHFF